MLVLFIMTGCWHAQSEGLFTEWPLLEVQPKPEVAPAIPDVIAPEVEMPTTQHCYIVAKDLKNDPLSEGICLTASQATVPAIDSSTAQLHQDLTQVQLFQYQPTSNESLVDLVGKFTRPHTKENLSWQVLTVVLNQHKCSQLIDSSHDLQSCTLDLPIAVPADLEKHAIHVFHNCSVDDWSSCFYRRES